MTHEDKASQPPPKTGGLPGPCVSPWSQPPSLPRRLQKVHLGEAGPSRHILTRRVSELSSQTMPNASLAPRHRHGPQRVAARPSWTPTHVDHRLVPPNHHEPNLSRYITDKVGAKEKRDRSFDSIPFLGLRSAPRARQPTEGHRELLHRIPSSSSTLTRGRHHRW